MERNDKHNYRTQVLDGELLASMLRAGCVNLRMHADEIDELNVFPIPDGDTGSNMLMTLKGGMSAVGAHAENVSLGETARCIANEMLLSARGNSGVILSQIFEGIAEGFDGMEYARTSDIVAALKSGVESSYRAVMEPTEGTMLTVMRLACEHVAENGAADVEALLDEFIDAAERTLEKTPDMLPVLKKAGVVDSGGAGLVCIAKGMAAHLKGEATTDESKEDDVADSSIDLDLFTEDSVLEYGYCTELLVRLQKCKTDPRTFDVKAITEQLGKIGDSIVALKKDGLIKLHIHTMTPSKVLEICQSYGEFLRVKIENMSLQHNNTIKPNDMAAVASSERKRFGVVAVAAGEGIKKLFLERGADVVADGGQSMNPSTEELLEAFDKVNADTIFVLPNNANIILTAKQAAQMYTAASVHVIESRNVGDGYAALSMLSYDTGDTYTIMSEMRDAMNGVVTADISRCVRDTDEARAGEYIGFVGKDILASCEDPLDAAKATVDALDVSCYDICIVIRGKDTTKDSANSLERYIGERCPSIEVYSIDGMQEIYEYIIILE